jgi:hypothetical protein
MNDKINLCKNIKKNKNKNKNKNIKNTIHLPRNSIREFLNNFVKKDIKDKLLGSYYMSLHSIIIFLGTTIILFSNNIFHLIVILICVAVDSLCIVILHDCPLTLLEKKYLGSSIAELREKRLADYNIVYKEDHLYETQIELLINLTCLIVFKILVLVFLDLFNIDKPNYPAIYASTLIKKYISPFIHTNTNFLKNIFFYSINIFIILIIIFIIYRYFMKNSSKDNKLNIKDNNNSRCNPTSKSIN